MSPKCEVASLASLALYSVVTQVIHALSDDESAHYDEVLEYLKYTPPEVLEDILAEVLRNGHLDAGTRFSCLQVFLCKNVKKLETGMFPHSYYNHILEVISGSGVGLVQLNLKGIWMKENPQLLCDVLKKLIHLKVLHIPHMANDDVLDSVTSCSDLRVLNISGECNFTPEGLNRFSKKLALNKSCLEILDLGSFGEENVPHECVANIIESLPCLGSLCSYSFVGKSLLYIYKKNSTFSCQLKHVHDTHTSPETMEAMLKCCPLLENLYLDTPEEGVIKQTGNFKTLNCLKLTKFGCAEINHLFADWGESLHTLKLSLGRSILDVSVISQACTNLRTLELYKMDFIKHTREAQFSKLERLEILHSEMASPCLKYILEKSPGLRKVVVSEAVKLTDGDLYRLCADMCLLCLEQIWFANARYLTVNAVELLMGQCPSLRVIGELTGWNITPNDVDFMRAIIQSTNTDLTLYPDGIFDF